MNPLPPQKRGGICPLCNRLLEDGITVQVYKKDKDADGVWAHPECIRDDERRKAEKRVHGNIVAGMIGRPDLKER